MKSIIALIVVVLAFAVAAHAGNRPCNYPPWDFCELADFGPYWVTDNTGKQWAISILNNMTCPQSVWQNGVRLDFKYAAACSLTAGNAENTALAAYGLYSPKVFSFKGPGQERAGAMIRAQAISTAYPTYEGLYSLLNIVVNCAPDVRAFPQNITMFAPLHPNEAYTVGLSHASGC